MTITMTSKRIKQAVTITISLVLILLCYKDVYASSAWASPDAGSVARGDYVTVYVGAQGSEAVKSLAIVVSYDTSVFEYVEGVWIFGETKAYEGGYGVALNTSATVPSGNVFYLTLRAKQSAPLGSSYVGFALTFGSDGETSNCGTNIEIACSHSFGAWTTDYEASCTEQGQEYRTCSICGTRDYRTIPAFGHSFGEWEPVSESTCTEGGSRRRVCKTCGFIEKNSLDPLGHQLEEGAEIVKEATCTEHGLAKGKCIRCGKTAEVETPFAPHTWGEWVDTAYATCTESGSRMHSCSVCGYEESQVSLPLGHDFTNGQLIREANIYTEGIFEAICSRCGAGGSIRSACSCTDEETGMYFETQPGVFAEGAEIKVAVAAESKHEETTVISSWLKGFSAAFRQIFGMKQKTSEDTGVLETVLNGISEQYIAYKISASANGADIEPDGPVTITFRVPDEYGRSVALYCIDESGNAQELPIEFNYADEDQRRILDEASGSQDSFHHMNTLTATVNHFSYYALVDLDENTSISALDTFRYILELALVILLLTMLALLLRKGKKKETLKKAQVAPYEELPVSEDTERLPEEAAEADEAPEEE